MKNSTKQILKNGITAIHFRASKNGKATIIFFDMLGRRVREFSRDVREDVGYQFKWDTKTDSKEKLPDGVYLYRLEINDSYVNSGQTLIL